MAHEHRNGPITRSMGEDLNREVGTSDTHFSDDVHSEMDHEEYQMLQGNGNYGGLHFKCPSESALNKGISKDATSLVDEIAALKRENRSLALDLYQYTKQLDISKQDIRKLRYELNRSQDNLVFITNDLTDTRYDLSKGQHELDQYKQVNSQQAREIDALKAELKRERDILQAVKTQNDVTTRFDYNHGHIAGDDRTQNNTHSSTSMYYGTQSQTNDRFSTSNTKSMTSHPDEPKFRLPYFNGKGDFMSFWSVFEIGVKKFHWDNEKQVEQLMCCIKDDALAFFAKLPSRVKDSITLIKEALDRRYGDHLLPEQYRENLNQVRKQTRESLSEYAARVEDLVGKAFPSLNPPELLTTLTIENLLRGLSDQSLAYEVRTKSPKSVNETIRLITWHDCCKNSGKKNAYIRQIEYKSSEEDENTNLEVRKVSGGRPRFVTEERLENRLGVFAKDIRQEIKEGNSQLKNEMKEEIGKMSTAIQKNLNHQKSNDGKHDTVRPALKDVTCYTCQKKGHINRFCPLNKGKNQSAENAKGNSYYGSNGQRLN